MSVSRLDRDVWDTDSVRVNCGLAATGVRKVIWTVGGTGVTRLGRTSDVAYPASSRGLLCET